LSEMGVEGVAEEFEDAATLLTAGSDHRPDAFTPTLPAFAPGSLRDVTVNHDVPNRLFRLVVRGLDPRRCQKEKVIVRLILGTPYLFRWRIEYAVPDIRNAGRADSTPRERGTPNGGLYFSGRNVSRSSSFRTRRRKSSSVLKRAFRYARRTSSASLTPMIQAPRHSKLTSSCSTH